MDFFNIGRTCTKPLFDEVSGARVGQHRKHKPQVTLLRCSVLRCHQPYAKNLSTLPYTPELLRLDCCDDTPAPSLQYIFACRTPPQQWKLELRLLVVNSCHAHTHILKLGPVFGALSGVVPAEAHRRRKVRQTILQSKAATTEGKGMRKRRKKKRRKMIAAKIAQTPPAARYCDNGGVLDNDNCGIH